MKKLNFMKIINIIGFLIAFSGACVSIFMNFVNRSLWLDEAMLAYSFSERSIGKLTASIFEWNQSAPVLWLYIVKILTLVFGNSEFVLRIFSVFAYIATLFLVYFVAKKVFSMRFPMLCVAFVANMNFMLKYSNDFKPYISDCVWVLLVVFLYALYVAQKVKFQVLIGSYMVLLWISNPTCFFIGAVLCYEFFTAFFQKNFRMVRNSILGGIGIGVSFIAYYFYWLRDVAVGDEMQNYWEGQSFPLFPHNIGDLKQANAMLYELFVTFREARIFVMGLLIVSILIGIFIEKNRYYCILTIGFVLTFFASSINMFPISDRLWAFSYPIFAILAFSAIDRMISMENKKTQYVAVALMFIMLWTNSGIKIYADGQNVYWTGEEANTLITYVQDHIEADETLFVGFQSIPVTKYKIGYQTNSIGKYKDNVVWEAKDSDLDTVDQIKKLDKCYILLSHIAEDKRSEILNPLKENGYVELIDNAYETPLYYYTKDYKESKAKVSYQVLSCETEGDTCKAVVRVKNIGSSYINTAYDDNAVRLISREREDAATNLYTNLEPGAYYDMPITFDWKGDTKVEVGLKNGDRYWFDELGCKPAVLIKK